LTWATPPRVPLRDRLLLAAKATLDPHWILNPAASIDWSFGTLIDMQPELSAVIVAVSEAEPLVGRLRAALDVHSAFGLPAHVTLMFPFLPPAELDAAAHTALAEVIAAAPAFDVVFDRVGWFDEDAAWLAPEPAEPFRALTRALSKRFGLLPYEGVHGTDITPHLTIGHGVAVPRLRAAAREVTGGLPVRASVRHARLMIGSRAQASWSTVAEFPLGGGSVAA
jgi:2'-5' RNA ligase